MLRDVDAVGGDLLWLGRVASPSLRIARMTVAGSLNVGAAVMVGMQLPDVDVWSERVVVALGQNPGVFTGPGTNTYLVGTGPQRILLDTGRGSPGLPATCSSAPARAPAATGLQEIVLTHGHPDHMGGVAGVLERFGPLRVSKLPWPGNDEQYACELDADRRRRRLRTDGATLRAVHTPGHAQDHLCFVLEEEQALFSGDNVLGVGTTVIPAQGGDLLDYMSSLERLLAEAPARDLSRARPADRRRRGEDPRVHRPPPRARGARSSRRSAQGSRASPTWSGASTPAYPESLHGAAAMSVASHLRKLEREGRVAREGARPARRDLEARLTHPLLRRLASADAEQRRQACLEAADDPAAVLLVPALAAALGDPAKAVARAASRRAGRAGPAPPRGAEALREALRAEPPRLRIQAALTLARLEPPEPRSLPALVAGARLRGRRRALGRDAGPGRDGTRAWRGAAASC